MILVTGGTGLIGGHLIHELLRSGHQVRAVTRSDENKEITREIFRYYGAGSDHLFEQIHWMKGDLLDIAFTEELMNDVSHVYHCAALVSFDPRDEKAILKNNIEGTANVVNAALGASIKKLCFVSSIASFGRTERGEPVREDSQWENNLSPSPYAESKYRAECEVWRATEEGLNTVIVNPSVVLGSGNWKRGSATLFTSIWRGLPYYTNGVNGFVDVKDVVSCMVKLMDSQIQNERFILVSENWSYRDLFNSIAASLNRKRPSIKVRKYMIATACRIDLIRSYITGRRPLITKETAKVAMDHQRYSNEKVRQALDHEFIPVQKSIETISKNFLEHIN